MGYETDAPPAPGLLFVHDQGVYLMSNGLPGDIDTDRNKRYVVYADGCDPDASAFDDWYETSRDLVGGDDFVEVLSLNNPQEFMANCAQYEEFCIELTETQLEAFFRGPKARPNTARRGARNGRRPSPAN